MMDDKMNIDTDGRAPHGEQLSWQTQPEQSGPKILQGHASAPNSASQPAQRLAPGRRPLFRS